MNNDFVNKRQIYIYHYFVSYFPNDIAKLIIDYDYYLEGTPFTLTDQAFGVICVDALPDGRIVTGCKDNTIKIWNPKTRMCDVILAGHTADVVCIAVYPNKHGALRLVSGSQNGTIKIWNLETGSCDITLLESMFIIREISILPDERILFRTANSLKIWNPQTRTCNNLVRMFYNIPFHVVIPYDFRNDISSDPSTISVSRGNIVLIDSNSNILDMYDIQTGEYIASLTGPQGYGQRIAVCYMEPKKIIEEVNVGDEVQIKIWNLQTRICENIFSIEYNCYTLYGIMHSIKILSDEQIVTVSFDGKILKVWNVHINKIKNHTMTKKIYLNGLDNILLQGHKRIITAFTILPYNSRNGKIVTCSNDNTIKIWS